MTKKFKISFVHSCDLNVSDSSSLNLTKTVYDFDRNQTSTTNNDYLERYRGDFLTPTYEVCKGIKDAEMNYDQRYQVYAGFIPITIEGNGADIKINENHLSNALHFAHI